MVKGGRDEGRGEEGGGDNRGKVYIINISL